MVFCARRLLLETGHRRGNRHRLACARLDNRQHGFSARTIVSTHGSLGGTYEASEGGSGSFEAAPLAGPKADAYGAGDSFAAGLTFGLGAGMDIGAALSVASRCGAGNLTGHGPYAGQPTATEIGLPPGRVSP